MPNYKLINGSSDDHIRFSPYFYLHHSTQKVFTRRTQSADQNAKLAQNTRKKTCPEQISVWVTLEHGRNSPVLLVRMAWSEFLSCFTFTLPNSRQELTHFRIASISSGDANMISSASRVSRKSCNSSFSTSLSRN